MLLAVLVLVQQQQQVRMLFSLLDCIAAAAAAAVGGAVVRAPRNTMSAGIRAVCSTLEAHHAATSEQQLKLIVAQPSVACDADVS